MGCTTSAFARETLRKYNPGFNKLGLTTAQSLRLIREFEKVDVGKARRINLDQLLMYVSMTPSLFSERVFSVLDTDRNGFIDVQEFVSQLWLYCTLDRGALEAFAFDLYDLDGSGEVSGDELLTIMHEVYGRSRRHTKMSMKMESDLLAFCGHSEVVDVVAFSTFVRTHPGLLQPAFTLQNKLQRHVCGQGFWRKAAEARLKNKSKDPNLDPMAWRALMADLIGMDFDSFASEERKRAQSQRRLGALAEEVVTGKGTPKAGELLKTPPKATKGHGSGMAWADANVDNGGSRRRSSSSSASRRGSRRADGSVVLPGSGKKKNKKRSNSNRGHSERHVKRSSNGSTTPRGSSHRGSIRSVQSEQSIRRRTSGTPVVGRYKRTSSNRSPARRARTHSNASQESASSRESRRRSGSQSPAHASASSRHSGSHYSGDEDGGFHGGGAAAIRAVIAGDDGDARLERKATATLAAGTLVSKGMGSDELDMEGVGPTRVTSDVMRLHDGSKTIIDVDLNKGVVYSVPRNLKEDAARRRREEDEELAKYFRPGYVKPQGLKRVDTASMSASHARENAEYLKWAQSEKLSRGATVAAGGSEFSELPHTESMTPGFFSGMSAKSEYQTTKTGEVKRRRGGAAYYS